MTPLKIRSKNLDIKMTIGSVFKRGSDDYYIITEILDINIFNAVPKYRYCQDQSGSWIPVLFNELNKDEQEIVKKQSELTFINVYNRILCNQEKNF